MAERTNGARPFLTAEWRDLALLNCEVDPAALGGLVPAGTEIDSRSGRVFVSIVGFRFLRHRDFEEVNLRFYLRRRADTEHHWGYARQRDGGTVEYRVEHPRWTVWRADAAALDCDVAALYGAGFEECLRAAPSSAFIAQGSAVVVRRGTRLP